MNTCIHLLIFLISLCLTGRNIQGQMKQFSIDKECKNKAMMGDYTLTFFTLIRTVHEPPGCSLFFLNQRLPTATWAVALLIKLIKKEPAWINWRGFFFFYRHQYVKTNSYYISSFFQLSVVCNERRRRAAEEGETSHTSGRTTHFMVSYQTEKPCSKM